MIRFRQNVHRLWKCMDTGIPVRVRLAESIRAVSYICWSYDTGSESVHFIPYSFFTHIEPIQ